MSFIVAYQTGTRTIFYIYYLTVGMMMPATLHVFTDIFSYNKRVLGLRDHFSQYGTHITDLFIYCDNIIELVSSWTKIDVFSKVINGVNIYFEGLFDYYR